MLNASPRPVYLQLFRRRGMVSIMGIVQDDQQVKMAESTGNVARWRRRTMAGAIAVGMVLPAILVGPGGMNVLQAAPRAGAAAAPAASGGLAEAPNQVRGDEITPAQQAAVEKGLAYLARAQMKNGAFGGEGGFGGGPGGHVGVTALAGIAFMGAGNLPNRGKYGENVKKIADFLVACTDRNGFISSGGGGEMYSHGFATLFLAEVYGMTQDDEVKEALLRAVKLIHRCQNQAGGWRYQPAPVDADISITICQVMALRAARDAGIKVEEATINKAVEYVKSCSCPDGGFSYTAGQGGGSGFARSAAGVATLYYAGRFDKDRARIEQGINYLNRMRPGTGAGNQTDGHYFYGNYYAVQAMFLAGGESWARWYPAIRDDLIARQNKGTGVWQGEISPDYDTAMALIILQMPNRYLPVFHGKGPGS